MLTCIRRLDRLFINHRPIISVMGGVPAFAEASSSSVLSPSWSVWEDQERRYILSEAAFLSRSLYRLCFRSARLLLTANELDEQEFQRREAKERELGLFPYMDDSRLSFVSMVPPVDRSSELESRYEYYCQYIQENFHGESDIFSSAALLDDSWSLQDFNRYFHYLTRGEQHRQWLLRDMKFSDPYKGRFDQKRANLLKERALSLFRQLDERTATARAQQLQQPSPLDWHGIHTSVPIGNQLPSENDQDGEEDEDDDDKPKKSKRK